MANIEFIKKYGKRNFISICQSIENNLIYYKYKKQISGYSISNRKGIVKIFYKKEVFKFEIADIYKDNAETLQEKMEQKIRGNLNATRV